MPVAIWNERAPGEARTEDRTMDKRFYPRLAWDCIRKNRRLYVPYLFTVAGAAAGFYILATTADPAGMADPGDVRLIMQLCTVVLALVCGGFLLYTNGFLMKQRGREFGLYAVLGLDRANLTRLLAWETAYTAAIGVGGGLAVGVLLDRLLLMILAKLSGLSYAGPAVYGRCLALTAGAFALILGLIFAANAVRVGHTKPSELLIKSNVGDKEPKSRWFIALVGVILLGAGYGIAIGRPALMRSVTPEDILWFFAAVLLVIGGTFALFLAGTVTALKLLRRWKGYYYKARHFVSVSGLIHRMGRNAAGLAIICILSTAVLVMVSSTVCLRMGLESNLRSYFPRDVMCQFGSMAENDWDGLLDGAMEDAVAAGYHPEDTVRYLYWEYGWSVDDGRTSTDLAFVDAAGYEAITGRALSLGPDEVLTDGAEDTLTVMDAAFTVAGGLGSEDPVMEYLGRALGVGDMEDMPRTLVVADGEAILALRQRAEEYGQTDPDYSCSYGTFVDHNMDFDLPAGEDSRACLAVIRQYVLDHVYEGAFSDGSASIGQARSDLLVEFGSLLFLGLFLGTLFLGGAALLIYYKQVSEGYEDRERFAVMRNVGMDDALVRRSIRSQILLVFFLPLVTALCHMAAAFPLVDRLLELWDMHDTGLFLACTLGAAAGFAALYAAVYLLTERVYARLVGR